MSHHKLDARRLLCPMPVIRTQNLVKTLNPGDTVEVTSTDPGALSDIPAWCKINGHKFLDHHKQGDELIMNIEVGED